MQESRKEESESMMPRPPTTAYSTRSGGLASLRPSRGIIAVAVSLLVIGIFVVPSFTGSGQGLRRSKDSASTLAAGGPCLSDSWQLLLITDLDKQSKVDDSGKSFYSILQEARLTRDPSTKEFTVSWASDTQLVSGHNEAGRGMELSELITYNGKLMTMDDRTGIVFEILGDGSERSMAPRYIITEGDGDADKGMKLEWATVKDGSLLVGSMGKEYTNDAGEIVNTNNLWVDFIDEHGEITSEDWTEYYTKLREAGGAPFPGYMIHEAAAWSSILHKWVFMPRRVSTEQYDEVADEKMGSNMILIADEDFGHVEVKHAGEVVPTHGFSSFKFLPGSDDKVVVALKSMEIEAESKQGTYLTVLSLEGEVLLDEIEVPGAHKFEGIEILPVPVSEDAGRRRYGRRKL